MNIERLTALAALLRSEKVKDHFDMEMFFAGFPDADCDDFRGKPADLHICGTTACIAGWTLYLQNPQMDLSKILSFSLAAARYLELDWELADRLFTPMGEYIDSQDPLAAAEVIDHLIATGEVDWSKAD